MKESSRHKWVVAQDVFTTVWRWYFYCRPSLFIRSFSLRRIADKCCHLRRVRKKRAFKHTQNAHSDHPAHAQSIIWSFALHSYILVNCSNALQIILSETIYMESETFILEWDDGDCS